MQISKYTIIVNDHPAQGEHLIFNARTQALVKINQDLKSILDKISNVSREEVGPYEKDLRKMFEMGLIVRDKKDDDERFEKFIEQRKYGIDRSNFTASILTTYNCNFACTYCFEESTRTSSQRLDVPTSDVIMAWIKKRAEKYRVAQLTINYYGGEPLLNQPIMEYISGHMKTWCTEKGMKFKVNIQTNGSLMTPEFLDKHIPLGLQSARISLDGTKETHDRQRPTRGSGAGTFDKVMENIKHAVDRIKISIAAGYDQGDTSGIIDLLDYLEDVGILHKLDNFMHTAVHPTLGPKENPGAIQSSQCMSNYESDTLLKTTQIIKERMRKKGMISKTGLSTSMCPLTRENGGVTIDTNGLLFKCNSMLGHPDLAIGNVREDEYNQRSKDFLNSDAWKKCDADCAYAPICNTGCRLFGFFKHQDFSAKSCEKEYMDKFIPMAIKKEYDLRLDLAKIKKTPVAV
jgi:uncharacterized protein